ncbi:MULTISPECIES: endonuclease III [Clostridium]|uniref:endonuclease III n=1 Tax=Clostridium TaxID=1485 RepID=UPI0022378CCC|nr:endonuclease III [Clostridium sporogenes]MCW6077255.1 endonuclease III [Clostridium sporogenes]MCW6112241.1 endonuclease III [Clostridium sporogenes]
MFIEYKKTIITLIKCFLILLFFCSLLPKALDIVLYNFFLKDKVYENSTLVFKNIDLKIKIIYNYILVFNNFLRGF